jgi:hypothetical protein
MKNRSTETAPLKSAGWSGLRTCQCNSLAVRLVSATASAASTRRSPESYGIYGPPEPGKISKTESHD